MAGGLIKIFKDKNQTDMQKKRAFYTASEFLNQRIVIMIRWRN